MSYNVFQWLLLKMRFRLLHMRRITLPVRRGVNFANIFTARCYASAVLAMGLCPSVSVCVCVCHKVGQNRPLSTNNRLYLENGTKQTHGFY